MVAVQLAYGEAIMKFTINEKEYTGPIAWIVAIPACVFIGAIFMALGFVMMSPFWLLLLLLRGAW